MIICSRVTGPERELRKHCKYQMTMEDREETPGHSRTNPNPRLTSDLESTRAHLLSLPENRQNIRSPHSLNLSSHQVCCCVPRKPPTRAWFYMNSILDELQTILYLLPFCNFFPINICNLAFSCTFN